jgi:photosystem II stability/assembly factor-like uncharacterized protein
LILYSFSFIFAKHIKISAEMKKITTALFVLLLTSALLAQSWTKNLPQDKIQSGNLTLPEIQKAFYDYWEPYNVVNGKYINDSGEELKAPGWKLFKRWEWKAGYLVDGQGNFPETSTPEEMEKYYDKYPESGKSTSGNWTNIGYSSTNGGYEGIGRVNCIAFHPTDNNTFWVGAPSGGLWRTTNGGASWTVLTDNNAVLGVSAIAITSNYSSSNTLYIGTGDRDGGSAWSLGGGNTHDNEGTGVLKSTNGGTSWTSSLSFLPSQKIIVYDLLIDPSNNNNLIAATGNGIYETTNAGSSWSQITTNICTDLEYKPGSSSIFYGAHQNAKYILKFTKSGTWSWALPTLPGSSSYRTELAVSANNTNVVYALAVNSGGGLEGIYKSTDSGVSYSLIFNGSTSGNNLLGYNCDGSTYTGQGTYDVFITANPSNANDVYVGGINVWRSTNGGTAWAIKSVWSGTCGGTVNEVHADQHCCEFQPGTSTVFIGHDGGVYKSTDNGSNWTDLSNNLTINQIYRLGLSKQSGNEIIIGLQDNGTHLYSGGSWTMDGVMGGDGMECFIDPTNTNVQYGSYHNGDIRRTINHWTSQSTITSGLSGNADWVAPFVCDPNVNTTLYIGYQEVFKSTNQGTSWSQISSFGGSTLRSIALAPSNSSYIYAATQTVLNKTTNGGSSWTNITTGLPVANGNITYIAVKNDDPNTVWVTIGGFNTDAVYQTTNGGTNWTNISSGLPSIPAMSVVQNIRNTSKVELYVAMTDGVYVKYGNSNWTAFKTGLPSVFCTELEIFYDNTTPSNCKIRVATFGRGLWESNIPVVDFAANNTLPPNVSTPVLIMDLSTNSPTAWSWSFNPNTVTFTGGTSSTSQNPIVLFTNPGAYTVTLTTTNAYGNDTETKTAYIHVGTPGLWTGNTSTDWNTSTNWQNHLTPTSALGVTINPGSSNWPIYTGNFNIGTPCATLAMTGNSEITVTGNLTIPAGKVLTCSGNSTINVGGDWINYGTFTPGMSVVKMNGNTNSLLTGNITTNGSQTSVYTGTYLYPGYYFDIVATGGKNISVNSFDIHCSTTGTVNVQVWYKTGTYTGNISNPGVWTQLGTTQTVTGQGYGNPTPVNPGASLTIPSGSTYGFYINCYSGSTGYIRFSAGYNTYSNADITINAGAGTWAIPVGSGGWNGYTFNGTVYYSYVIPNTIPFWDLEINKTNALVSTNGNMTINNNLTVKPGAWFTNSAGNMINVLGSALLEANSSGMASYIDNGTTSVAGTTTVQEYLSQDVWHFVSPPVYNALSGVYTGIYLRTFNEATDSWNAYITSTVSPLLPMNGYATWKSSSPATVSLAGQLNNGPYSINVTRNSTQTDQGWNLVGNPYPSALDWDASGWTKTNINNTIYYYSGASGLSNYHYYIGAGGETPGIGVNNGTKYIPSTQGFFVHASASGILGVTNTVRVHNTQAFYKDTSVIPTIRLVTSQGELSDETVIRFVEGSSMDFDGDFDAFKLYGDNVPQIYSLTQNQTELAINTFTGYDDETIISIGFIAPGLNDFKITLTEFENFEPGTCLYLEDITTGIIHKISESPEYTFVASPLEDYNRFRLHFGNPNGVGETFPNQIRIYSENNEIHILNLTGGQASVYAYDMMGRMVAEKQVNVDNNTVINVIGETGYYLVKVRLVDQLVTERVFIK